MWSQDWSLLVTTPGFQEAVVPERGLGRVLHCSLLTRFGVGVELPAGACGQKAGCEPQLCGSSGLWARALRKDRQARRSPVPGGRRAREEGGLLPRLWRARPAPHLKASEGSTGPDQAQGLPHSLGEVLRAREEAEPRLVAWRAEGRTEAKGGSPRGVWACDPQACLPQAPTCAQHPRTRTPEQGPGSHWAEPGPRLGTEKQEPWPGGRVSGCSGGPRFKAL